MATIKKLKKKKTRKEILQPDEFLTKSKDLFDILTEHWQLVTIGFVSVLVLVAVTIGWHGYSTNRDQGATALLGEALKVLDAPIVPEGTEPPTGLDGKPVEKYFTDEQARLEAAEKILSKLEEDYGGSNLAKSSKLLLASLKMESKDYAKAIETYKDFLEDPVDVTYIKYLAMQDLAYAYEEKGDLDSALAEFQKIAAKADNNPIQDEAFFQVGRLQEKRGDLNAARTAYTELIEAFPDSARKKEAQARLMEIEAKLAKSDNHGTAEKTATPDRPDSSAKKEASKPKGEQ